MKPHGKHMRNFPKCNGVNQHFYSQIHRAYRSIHTHARTRVARKKSLGQTLDYNRTNRARGPRCVCRCLCSLGRKYQNAKWRVIWREWDLARIKCRVRAPLLVPVNRHSMRCWSLRFRVAGWYGRSLKLEGARLELARFLLVFFDQFVDPKLENWPQIWGERNQKFDEL